MAESTNSSMSSGQGGKEPFVPRYIYYRFYTKEGALESNNPIYSDDNFISRILSKSVTPPHTVASLKAHLCWIEGFEAPKTCDLYLSLSETASMDDCTRIQLRGKDPGPGVSEFEPIALVIDIRAVEKRLSTTRRVDSTELPEWQDQLRYIYYRVYNERGEFASKTSFDETDVSLGRINVLSIPPPHTGASLRSWLVNVEGAIDRNVQLFEDEGGDATIKDDDSIALLCDTCPGVSKDSPMAFVHVPQKDISAQQSLDSVSKFSKRLKATRNQNWGEYSSAWHTTLKGQIFKTDGVLRKEKFGMFTHKCYEAINSSGKRAFLLRSDSAFC